MMLWLPLLIAPLLVLAEQALAFALTPALCATQRGEWLHAVAAAFVLATALLTVLAVRALSRVDRQRLLFARAAAGVAALSTLTLLALWLPNWVIEPCIG